MAKIIEFLPVASTDDVERVVAAMLADPRIHGLVLNVADQRPQGSPDPVYGAALEVWAPTVGDYVRARDTVAAPTLGAQSAIAYSVSERVQGSSSQLAMRRAVAGCQGDIPGRRPELTDEEGKRRGKLRGCCARVSCRHDALRAERRSSAP
jgi:hypothetical protein